jgi:dihydrofolate reductase
MGETLGAITGASKAILLGRKTYEMFAPAWSTRTVEDDPGAPFFNNTHKYVVGSTEPNVDWGPSTRLGPYDPDAIRMLKDETDGVIYISGSGTLVRALLKDSLVDDLHLFVYPVALGQGKRLWDEGVDQTKLTLKEQDAYNNGVVHLNYGPA